MMFSVKTAFTLALLGLGNVIPSAYAAPTAISEVRDAPQPELVDPEGLFGKALVARGRGGGSGGGSGGGGSGGGGSGGGGTNPGGFGGGGGGGGGGNNAPNPGGFGGGGTGGGTGNAGGNPNHPDVPNVEQRGFTVNQRTNGNEDTFEVTAQNGAVVGNIRVDRNENTVTLDEVDMKAAGDDPNRPRLFEVVMSLFVHRSGKNPNDMESVHAENVSEEGTMAVLERSSQKKAAAGQDTESYTVNRSSAGADKEIFDDFMANSAFGKSADKMTAGTPGFNKQVTQIGVGPGAGGGEDSNVSFHFANK